MSQLSHLPLTTQDYKFLFWGPFLQTARVTESTLDLLMNESSKLTIEKDDARSHLAGKIQDEKHFRFNQPHLAPAMQELSNLMAGYVINAGKHYYNQNVDPKSFFIEWQGLWINKQVAGEFNPLHRHSGDISFVFYPQVPEEIYNEVNITTNKLPPGWIEFRDSFDLHTASELRKDEVIKVLEPLRAIHIRPERGLMLIFPSWLHHTVMSFDTPNVERISISGNVYVRDADKNPL